MFRLDKHVTFFVIVLFLLPIYLLDCFRLHNVHHLCYLVGLHSVVLRNGKQCTTSYSIHVRNDKPLCNSYPCLLVLP